MINSFFLNRIKSDRWYWLIILGLAVLLLLLHVFEGVSLSFFNTEVLKIPKPGDPQKYVSINLFDGIIFTVFIIATMFFAWYFGGHSAFMFIAVSWNFEVLLFMAFTRRYELSIELLNLILFVFLYLRESPADKKRRIYQDLIETKNIQLFTTNIAYARFVPENFIRLMKKPNIQEVKLGDSVQHEMSILFSDIRSFTSISELMTPQENFDFINSYLKKISPIVRQNKGFIDKYIGDAIMALFPENPENALTCALQMQDALEKFNQEQKAKGSFEIKTGIGIHTGLLMMGPVGESERMDGTVIGDCVNLASRLENYTKTYGAEIIVSEYLLSKISQMEKYSIRFLDNIKPKGKTSIVSIYEIINKPFLPENKKKLDYQSQYMQAVKNFYITEYQAAFEIFTELNNLNHADKAVKCFLDKTVNKLKLLDIKDSKEIKE
jgi:class 3 adenylate cyclase